MKSVLDLISIDLKTLPDSHSVEVGKRTNSAGAKLTEYSHLLETPECGLFKIARILVFEEGSKNVILTNPNLASVKILTLEKLVNQLFSFYGPDTNTKPRGLFSRDDHIGVQSMLDDPSSGFWIGRMWGSPDYVHIDLDDEGLHMFVGLPSGHAT